MSKKIGTSNAPKRSILNTMALSVLRCGVRAGLSTAVSGYVRDFPRASHVVSMLGQIQASHTKSSHNPVRACT